MADKGTKAKQDLPHVGTKTGRFPLVPPFPVRRELGRCGLKEPALNSHSSINDKGLTGDKFC